VQLPSGSSCSLAIGIGLAGSQPTTFEVKRLRKRRLKQATFMDAGNLIPPQESFGLRVPCVTPIPVRRARPV